MYFVMRQVQDPYNPRQWHVMRYGKMTDRLPTAIKTSNSIQNSWVEDDKRNIVHQNIRKDIQV